MPDSSKDRYCNHIQVGLFNKCLSKFQFAIICSEERAVLTITNKTVIINNSLNFNHLKTNLILTR